MFCSSFCKKKNKEKVWLFFRSKVFLSIHLHVLFYSISILFQLLVFFLNIVNIFYTQIAGKDTLEELTSVEKDRIEEKLVSHVYQMFH